MTGKIAVFLLSSLAVHAIDFNASLARKMLEETEGKMQPTAALSAPNIDILDPDSYIVGGGDAFQIAIKGLPSQEYFPVVNSDGNIYIGDFGEITVGRVTLRKAVKMIQERSHVALGRRYQVYVALKRVKKATVSIGYGVSHPGTYELDGTLRLMDALKRANRGEIPSPEDYDLRQILRKNGDSVATFDLLRFLATRDPSQNPYVYPGDYYEVRALDETFTLAGQVFGPFAGRLPLRRGETLADILPALNLRSLADTSVLLVRSAGNETRRVERSEAAGVVIVNNDVIIVPSLENIGSQDTVRVTGEVARKGTYPVTWGVTTAKQILELAGGPSAKANAARAIVIRHGKRVDGSVSPAQVALRPEPRSVRQVSAYSVRPEINSSINELAATNDFTVIRLSDHPGGVLLEDGDELHVPRKEFFVYVSGHVNHPGAYAYKAGEDADFYVEEARGYSHRADPSNRVIMARYGDVLQFKDNGNIEDGDVIVVPASVQHKNLTAIYLPILQASLAVLSLVLTFIVVTK